LKTLSIILLILFWGLLVLTVTELPGRGDPQSPANRLHSPAGSPVASSYYTQKALEETATPNVVTAILADYRGYDTLGETVVIFCAGLACFLILRRSKDDEAN